MDRHHRAARRLAAGGLALGLLATGPVATAAYAQAPTVLDRPTQIPTLARKVRKTIGFVGGGPMPLLPPRAEALPTATPIVQPALADEAPQRLVRSQTDAPTQVPARERPPRRPTPQIKPVPPQRASASPPTLTRRSPAIETAPTPVVTAASAAPEEAPAVAGGEPAATTQPATGPANAQPFPAANPRRKASASPAATSEESAPPEIDAPLRPDPALLAAAEAEERETPRSGLSLPDLLIGTAVAAEADGQLADGAQISEEADGAEVAEPVPPTRLPRFLRMLSALQDDMARGAGAALEAQRVLLARIGEEIDAASAEQLEVPVNRRSVMRYALSGGSAQSLRGVLNKVEYDPPYDSLLSGALAFTEGRGADARRHLGPLNPDDFPLTVRGPLHLTLAALAAEGNAQQAFTHLEAARTIGVGTLIEEAALRRALLIAAELDDVERLEPLTSRYLRRFSNSIYAGNFRRRLAAALTRMAFLEEPGGFEALDTLLAAMTPQSRRQILLDLSRSAVESGRSGIGAKAAARAQEDAPEEGLDRPRAALYAAAAGVVDAERLTQSLATLATMDEAELPEEDRALRQAALSLGRAIETLPAPDRTADESAADAADPPDTLTPTREIGPSDEEFSALASRVDDAVASIDDLLRRTP